MPVYHYTTQQERRMSPSDPPVEWPAYSRRTTMCMYVVVRWERKVLQLEKYES